MKIQEEFQEHNPGLVYIDHKYLDGGRVGISFIAIGSCGVMGGVRVYKAFGGKIDWHGKRETFLSWADVKQKQR